MNDNLHKMVNGQQVPMTPQEEAVVRAAWAEEDDQIRFNAHVALRRKAYKECFGEIHCQLDYIYHNGLDGWRAKITEIKERYPKLERGEMPPSFYPIP